MDIDKLQQHLSLTTTHACNVIVAMKKSGLVAPLPSKPERKLDFARNLLINLLGVAEQDIPAAALNECAEQVLARLTSAVAILPPSRQTFDW